jgi:phosphate transport system substrate-binding protein
MKTLMSTFILVLFGAAGLLQAADDDLVVIVNNGNPTQNLTKVQLRKILLGEQDSWPGGKKVSIVLRTPGDPDRAGALRSVCGMSEDEFNQHLMHANFQGETGGAPKAVGSAAAVRQLVGALPGGVGFVHAADVTGAVKAVTVDGVAAGQPGYKLKAGK